MLTYVNIHTLLYHIYSIPQPKKGYLQINGQITEHYIAAKGEFMEEFMVHLGAINDLDLLVEHRMLMWRDIHPELSSELEDHRHLTRNWVQEKLLEKKLVPFIVKTKSEEVAGSGCILIQEDQPRPSVRKSEHPYLLSMYTLPKFREKGVASLVVKEAIDWSISHGYDRITLHASDQGKSIYEKFGFQQTNEMRLKLI